MIPLSNHNCSLLNSTKKKWKGGSLQFYTIQPMLWYTLKTLKRDCEDTWRWTPINHGIYNGIYNVKKAYDIIEERKRQNKMFNKKLYELIWNNDASLVVKKRTPMSANWNKQDVWKWESNNRGDYYVKEAYTYLQGRIHSNVGEPDAAFKALWRSHALPRMKMLAWKLLHNRVATTVELQKRGILPNTIAPMCELCNIEQESISHLFFECLVSQGLWKECLAWLGVQAPISNVSRISFLQFGNLFQTKALRRLAFGIWTCVVWLIWKTRNDIKFDNGAWNTS